MAKIPGTESTVELLVNCKTYPAISSKYVETVCTGGVQATGEFVRLYPVQFRFLEKVQQYRRWDVIRVRAYRDTKDTRPESWHLMAGTDIEVIDHVKSERSRWDWMRQTVHSSTEAMDKVDVTNGCVEIEPIELYWKPDKVEWTEKQKQLIAQGDFFLDSDALKSVEQRVPFQFRLRYREKCTGIELDSKVLAWSYYLGYQKRKAEGLSDENAMDVVADKVRLSIFNPRRTIFGIFGTHSRFGSWMISAIYHVPTEFVEEGRLF